MTLTVSEAARLAGVSVRTLHYYDRIGLLRPETVLPSNGYRCYGEASLLRLRQIMFYRELDFSLDEIKQLMSGGGCDVQSLAGGQKKLLMLKKQRIEQLIDTLDKIEKGEINMSFDAFDNSEYNKKKDEYASEVKQKWGETDAYKESQSKTKGYTDEKWAAVNGEGDTIMSDFGGCMAKGFSCDSDEAIELVKRWQEYISRNFYNCTKEILAGLAQMYVCDERFTANIDRFGKGTAEFMSQAILHYCR